jgi:hypothetical protein
MTTPNTIGPQKPQPDPRGILVFDWLPADLQNAEDSRQAADYEWINGDHHYALPRGNFLWRRAATSAERVLLQHLGYQLPDVLWTNVTYWTQGVRHRSWPQLADQTPTITEGE